MIATALIVAGALGVTVAVLAIAVWLIGRAEDRHERRENEAMCR